jgi:hypothetical protein
MLLTLLPPASLGAEAMRDDSRVPGLVIAHVPAESGRYIGSPSLAVLPTGAYVASHDVFGPESGSTSNARSAVYGSTDRGASWRKLAEIAPMFWGKLFVHRDRLYMLGTRHEYGDVLLRRSDDGGRTWSDPLTPTTGLLQTGRYHCAPCPVLVHGGRLWRSMERFTGGAWGNFEALVISAPIDADLLDAAAWRWSEPLPRPTGFAWLEGNVLLDPGGGLVNLMRTNGAGDDRAALVRIAPDGHALRFDPDQDLVAMPGGGAKFTVRHDPSTGRYWTVANQQTNPGAYRNRLVLASSPDLLTWQVESILLQHPDRDRHAWQYIDWHFDGADIILVSRTAFDDGLGGAHRAHDANYLTFHRIARP